MIPKNRPPTHPEEILLEEFLKPLQVSLEEFSHYLSESWTTKKRITEAIALDLARTLGTSPEFWLNLQKRYDLYSKKKIDKS